MIALFYALILLSADAQPKSFCERLAETTKMEAVQDGASGKIWRRSMLRLKDYLIGGSEATVIKIDVGDNPSLEDFKRVHESCGTEKNGNAFCNISGPEIFVLSMFGQEATIKVKEGEAAEVRTGAHYVTCRDNAVTPKF